MKPLILCSPNHETIIHCVFSLSEVIYIHPSMRSFTVLTPSFLFTIHLTRLYCFFVVVFRQMKPSIFVLPFPNISSLWKAHWVIYPPMASFTLFSSSLTTFIPFSLPDLSIHGIVHVIRVVFNNIHSLFTTWSIHPWHRSRYSLSIRGIIHVILVVFNNIHSLFTT